MLLAVLISCRWAPFALQANEDASELKQQSVALKEKLASTEADVKLAAEERDRAIAPIGNLVHDSVPIDDDEVSRASHKCIRLIRCLLHQSSASGYGIHGHAHEHVTLSTSPNMRQLTLLHSAVEPYGIIENHARICPL